MRVKFIYFLKFYNYQFCQIILHNCHIRFIQTPVGSAISMAAAIVNLTNSATCSKLILSVVSVVVCMYGFSGNSEGDDAGKLYAWKEAWSEQAYPQ